MKRLLLAAALLALALPAHAAPLSSPCLQTAAQGPCPPVYSGNPMPVYQAPSSVSGAGATVISTAALASNLVVKGSAGNLFSFEVAADSTLSAAAWWIIIFDATALPSNGPITPAKCYAMPSGTTSFTGAFPNPVRFTTGIVIGVSTTGCFTQTASVHAFISGDFK